LRRSAHGWQRDFYELKNSASSRNLPVYIVTASANDAAQALGKTSFGDVPVMDCDFTVIRSAARTNPCLYLLGKGTVINKWSYKRIGDAVASLRR